MKQQILTRMAITPSGWLLLAAAANLAAQDLGSLGKQAQSLSGISSLPALAQKLHLTPQQLQQVLPILQGEIPKLQGIANKMGLSNTQKLEQTKAVRILLESVGATTALNNQISVDLGNALDPSFVCLHWTIEANRML